MAGALPQPPVDELRRVDLDVAFARQPAAHVVLDPEIERPAARVPEDRARRLLLQVEQAHLAAQAAMVALFRLLQHGEMGVELGLRRPGGAVDALQPGVAGIAAPVGARHLHQLERLAEVLRRRQVRAAAEVEPVALPVDADRLAGGDVGDDLGLVVLADRLEVADGVVAVPDLAADRLVAIDDLAHPRLDLRQLVRGERLHRGRSRNRSRSRSPARSSPACRDKALGPLPP